MGASQSEVDDKLIAELKKHGIHSIRRPADYDELDRWCNANPVTHYALIVLALRYPGMLKRRYPKVAAVVEPWDWKHVKRVSHSSTVVWNHAVGVENKMATCALCHNMVSKDNRDSYRLGHIVGVAWGCGDSLCNITIVHKTCNPSNRSMPMNVAQWEVDLARRELLGAQIPRIEETCLII